MYWVTNWLFFYVLRTDFFLSFYFSFTGINVLAPSALATMLLPTLASVVNPNSGRPMRKMACFSFVLNVICCLLLPSCYRAFVNINVDYSMTLL